VELEVVDARMQQEAMEGARVVARGVDDAPFASGLVAQRLEQRQIQTAPRFGAQSGSRTAFTLAYAGRGSAPAASATALELL